MADITITAANVAPGANAVKKHGVAGEAITAGQIVYVTTAGLVMLAQADDTAAAAAAVGIAISTAEAANQSISYVVDDDDFTIGGTVAVGSAYVVSATAGGLAPEADLTTGNYSTFVCIGKSTTKVVVKPVATAAQHA